MRRINEVVYNKAAGTVDLGAGNLWDHVYEELDGLGVGRRKGEWQMLVRGGSPRSIVGACLVEDLVGSYLSCSFY